MAAVLGSFLVWALATDKLDAWIKLATVASTKKTVVKKSEQTEQSYSDVDGGTGEAYDFSGLFNAVKGFFE